MAEKEDAMEFYCNGKTHDTDKYLYVVGITYERNGSWYPFKKGDSFYGPKDIIKCKQGTIKRIYMDYNYGQSFVKGFDIEVPSYDLSLDRNKVVFAESPQKARKKYDDMVRGKKS